MIYLWKKVVKGDADMSMFKLLEITKTYSDPSTSVCRIGYITNNPKYMRGDWVILAEKISQARIVINHNVLIEALLSNRELLKKHGIFLTTAEEMSKKSKAKAEVKAQPEPQPEPQPKPKPQPKPEIKEEVKAEAEAKEE